MAGRCTNCHRGQHQRRRRNYAGISSARKRYGHVGFLLYVAESLNVGARVLPVWHRHLPSNAKILLPRWLRFRHCHHDGRGRTGTTKACGHVNTSGIGYRFPIGTVARGKATQFSRGAGLYL
jgi:hypothetical protein